jgi:nucleotide-binding universal stress UspA family protein
MVQPFTKVLVGTDFSDPAGRAVERACDLARRFGAALHVVHVWEVPLIVGGAIAGSDIDWITPIEGSARSQLGAVVGGLEGSGVVVTSTLCSGAAWDRIVNVATEQGADLVVVGTHGRTGLRRALMGSVAEQVVRHSPVAVLTVR